MIILGITEKRLKDLLAGPDDFVQPRVECMLSKLADDTGLGAAVTLLTLLRNERPEKDI